MNVFTEKCVPLIKQKGRNVKPNMEKKINRLVKNVNRQFKT